MQARPFKRLTDDFVALASSVALVTLFLGCLVIKVGTLTELQAVKEILPEEFRVQFDVPSAFLSVILLASVVGSIAFSFAIALKQAKDEKEREAREARAASARRLRYVRDGSEVLLGPPVVPEPAPPPSAISNAINRAAKDFHLFLSHVVC